MGYEDDMGSERAIQRERAGMERARQSAYWDYVNEVRKPSARAVLGEPDAEPRRRYVRPGWLAFMMDNYGSKFTDHQREALELIYGEGLNAADAARRSGCSHDQMRRRLFWARRKVRKVLGA